MSMFKRARGLTYIETMMSAVIVSFVVLSSVNLITRVYKYVTSSQLKAYSMNMVSENIDLLKQSGYDTVKITPDACLSNANTPNLAQFEACANTLNPYAVKIENVAGITYKIYRIVTYATDDGSGNFIGKLQSALPASYDQNIKQITVVVTYNADNLTKTSSLSTLISNRTIPMSGATVTGYVYKYNAFSTPVPPGTSSNAAVHFVGYPQYTAYANGSTGQYFITNVAPGAYTLFADGAGISLTSYASNPIAVPLSGQAVTAVNFNCVAIDGGIVTGNVYVNILLPTHTYTPTPIPTSTSTPSTKLLYGTGAMTGKTQTWTSPTYINALDGNLASTSGNTLRYLYTEFADFTSANTCITQVIFNVSAGQSWTGKTLKINFTDDSGVHWAVPTWTGLYTNNFVSYSLPGGNIVSAPQALYYTDITSLYATWDWTKVNTLGSVLSVNAGSLQWVECDAAWLEVKYYNCAPTLTVTNTPVVTNTPTMTPAIYCATGANVQSLDGLSAIATVSSSNCSFTISNINTSAGDTTIISYIINGSTLYYGVTKVAVALGSITYAGLSLTAASGTTGIVSGNVLDSSNNPLSGAQVTISDPSVVSPTTTSGGTFSFINVAPGNWTLYATKPGYMSANSSIAVTGGVINALTSPMILTQAGSLSGNIVDSLTGNPIGGVWLQAYDSGGTNRGRSDAYSDTVTGYYVINEIPVGTNYQVWPSLDISAYDVSSPPVKKYTGITIAYGTTATNKNFKLKQTYNYITGKVAVDSSDLSNGIEVMAYPTGQTVVAYTFNMAHPNPLYLQHTGRSRINYPYYGVIGTHTANFSVNVPVGKNYDIYAFYSYVSYTGSPQNLIKTTQNYYKKITNVSPGATNQNITGDLSTWSIYPTPSP